MKKILVLSIILLKAIGCSAQAGSWQTLLNAPQSPYRHDDVFFLNDSIGWLVNNAGLIYRTNNSGANWTQQFFHPTAYFRCVGFADTLNGWAGNLGAQSWGGASDTNCLYETHNGGATWNAVTNIIGPKPMGLCGINVLDAQNIYAVGRIEGPVNFIKSNNGGSTWYSQDMSSYCKDLVDVKFFNVDTGFIVGGTSDTFELSHAVILKTVDGGTTWQNIYTSSQDSVWCWKQAWPTPNTGYVSMQRESGPVHFLKTTDGGITWNENLLTNTYYFCQGIGFLNDTVGWIGGDFGNNNSFQTTDGGITWSTVNFGSRLNRFRFTSDTTGYCCGRRVYRYSNLFTGLQTNLTSTANYSFNLLSANPSKQKITVEFIIPSKQNVEISLFDLAGRKLKTLLSTIMIQGKHQLSFELPESINGIFFCSFTTIEFEKIITIVKVK